MSIINPIQNPIIGPKYHPIIYVGNHAKLIEIPVLIFTTKKLFKIMLIPIKQARILIQLIDEKTFIG